MKKIVLLLCLVSTIVFGGVRYDGIDDYIYVPATTSIGQGSYTIMFWVYLEPQNFSGSRYLGIKLGQMSGYGIYVANFFINDTQLACNNGSNQDWENNYARIEVNISTQNYVNKWIHLAIVRRFGIGFYLYQNGNLMGSNTARALTLDLRNDSTLTIGGYANAGVPIDNLHMVGTIDDYIVLERACSQDEIRATMDTYKIPDKNTSANLRFDDGGTNGQITPDNSGNQKNGTHVGTSTTWRGKNILSQPIYAGD